MKKFILISMAIILQGGQAFADLPPNDLYLLDGKHRRPPQIDEETFNQIIDKIEAIYAPVVQKHSAQLEIVRNWTDPTVNAYAEQTGNTWKVSMFGGLARHPVVTPDGFAMVVCHELGHHLGGYPFYSGMSWAAAEGAADYFATQTCAKRIWANDLEENASFEDKVHPTVKAKCDEAYASQRQRQLCYRTAMAGYSLGNLLGILGGTQVSFEAEDRHIVTQTKESHPAAQCRLDTYVSGGICGRMIPDSIIPGKIGDGSSNDKNAELQAGVFSCMNADMRAFGARPACWFGEQRSPIVGLQKWDWIEVVGNGNGIPEPAEILSFSGSLSNASSEGFAGLNASLTSSSAEIIILKNTSKLSELPAYGTSDLDSQFVIYIKDVAYCGSPFDLQLQLKSKDRLGKVDFFNQIGTHEESWREELEVQKHIPDKGKGRVIEAFFVDRAFSPIALNIELKIQHRYISDLRYYLITPAGDKLPISVQADKLESEDQTPTFLISAHHFFEPHMGSVGLWGIMIEDTYTSDEGNLQSWSAVFDEAICEAN